MPEISKSPLEIMDAARAGIAAGAVLATYLGADYSIKRRREIHESIAQDIIDESVEKTARAHAIPVPGLQEILGTSDIKEPVIPTEKISFNDEDVNKKQSKILGGVAVAMALWAGIGGPMASRITHKQEGTIVVLVDESGSTGTVDVKRDDGSFITRMDAIKQAATDFVKTKPENLKVELIGFGSKDIYTELSNTTDISTITSGIDNLKTYKDSGTDLSGAIVRTVNIADTELATRNKNNPKKVVKDKLTTIVLTDGMNNGSLSMRDVPEALQNKVEVNIALFGNNTPDNQVLKAKELAGVVTSETGGELFDISTEKDSVKKMTNVFDKIAKRTTKSSEETSLWYVPAVLSALFLTASRIVKIPKIKVKKD